MDNFENNFSLDEMINLLFKMNKISLDRKPYIKKYYHLRDVHSDVLNNLSEYLFSGSYNIDLYFKTVLNEVNDELQNVIIDIDTRNMDDLLLINELFIYKNYPTVPSVTEIYIDKNRFRN